MSPPERRTPPDGGGAHQDSFAAVGVDPAYSAGVTFTCPVTGLELDAPPLSSVIDEGHRLIAGSADNALILAADRIHAGDYRMAATRLRLLADRLDTAADTLDEWAHRRMVVA